MNLSETFAAARAYEKFVAEHEGHPLRSAHTDPDGYTALYCILCRFVWKPGEEPEPVRFDGNHLRPDPE